MIFCCCCWWEEVRKKRNKKNFHNLKKKFLYFSCCLFLSLVFTCVHLIFLNTYWRKKNLSFETISITTLFTTTIEWVSELFVSKLLLIVNPHKFIVFFPSYLVNKNVYNKTHTHIHMNESILKPTNNIQYIYNKSSRWIMTMNLNNRVFFFKCLIMPNRSRNK